MEGERARAQVRDLVQHQSQWRFESTARVCRRELARRLRDVLEERRDER